jgi:hypothetical protein
MTAAQSATRSNGVSDDLRRASKECSGWEPSLSVLERAADEAADLIDDLCGALEDTRRRWLTMPLCARRNEAIDKIDAALSRARGEA